MGRLVAGRVRPMAVAVAAVLVMVAQGMAQERKPNILFIVSDDTGMATSAPMAGARGAASRRLRPTSRPRRG